MIRLKKMMALVIAMVMVICTMNFTVFAEPQQAGALTVNGSLKVSGLDAGDVVTYYQILKWNDTDTATATQGWTWGEDINTQGELTDADLATITGTTDGGGRINGEMASKIAQNVTGGTTTAAIEGTEWTTTVTDAGLYMIIVTPKAPGTIYNPIFVAANWVGTGEQPDSSNQIAVSKNELTYHDEAMAKKTVFEVHKRATHTDEPDDTETVYTTDVGEVIEFAVDSVVPKYAANYTNPVFKLVDHLSGLELDASTVHVYKYDNETKGDELKETDGYFTLKTGTDTYTITFDPDYIRGIGNGPKIPVGGQPVLIEYNAKVTDQAEKIVNQDKNTVDLIYSTNPSDTTGAGLIRDETNHFTFSIDADLFGNHINEGSSTEAIKVGVDANGNPIVESSTEYWSEQTHAPLEGAEFTLYTDPDCQIKYTNDIFEGVVVSDASGRLTMKGLDAGTYYLKETKAPKGYVRYPEVVTVTIAADIRTDVSVKDEVDLNGTKVEVTYTTNILDGWTVTFTDSNGTVSTNYTIEEYSIDISNVERVDPPSSDKEFPNVKGVELPSTGGMGTTIFYVIGAILVLGAGILLVTRRRMDIG